MTVLVLAAALAAATPSPEAPRELTLDEALALAARNQPSLIQANALTEASRERASQNFGALLPQVTGNASYSFNDQTTRFAVSGQPNFQLDHRFWNAGLSLNQLIWDFGRTSKQYSAAEHSAASQAESGRQTFLQVTEDVRTSFFAARGQKALVQVAQQNLDSQVAHLQQIQGFVSVGTRPEIDLSQGRANVANAKVQLITAKNNYATAKAQLYRFIGLDAPPDYEVADVSMPPVEDENAPINDLVQRAWAARPDSKAFDELILAERDLASSARGAYWPSIGASASAAQSGNIPSAPANSFAALGSSTVPTTTTNLTAGLGLTWQIFTGGSQQAAAREADWQAKALEAQKDGLVQDIRVQVEAAQLAVHADQEALVAAQEAETSARDRLRLAEGRYTAGVGTIIELSDAQSAQTSAEAQLVQAAYNLSTARAQLLFALGRP